MRCDEFERRLNEALDARRNPSDDAGLARHAARCGKCRQFAAAMEIVTESLRWTPAAEPDELLAEQVLARTSVPAVRTPAHWGLSTHATLAAAIAVLVMVGLPSSRAPESPPEQIAATFDVPQPAAPVARVEAPVGMLAREATAHYATLARHTTDSFSGVWSLWPPALEETPSAAPSEQESLQRPVLADVASGLRPLADTAAGAVSFLLDVLPQGETAPAAAVEHLDAPPGQTAT